MGKYNRKLLESVRKVSPSAVVLDDDEVLRSWQALAARIAELYDRSAHAELKKCNYQARWKLEKILDSCGATGFPDRLPWTIGDDVILIRIDIVQPFACVIRADELSCDFSKYGHAIIAARYPSSSSKVILYDLNDDQTRPMHLKL